jgi:hypothetical protein
MSTRAPAGRNGQNRWSVGTSSATARSCCLSDYCGQYPWRASGVTRSFFFEFITGLVTGLSDEGAVVRKGRLADLA